MYPKNNFWIKLYIYKVFCYILDSMKGDVEMKLSEFHELQHENTKMEVLMGILEERTVLTPFVLDLDMCTIKIFVSELEDVPVHEAEMDEVEIKELQMLVFEKTEEAEQFYNDIYNGRYMEDLIQGYLNNSKK